MSKDFFSDMVDRIWDSWTSVSRGLSGEKLGMTKLALQQLYDWFIRRAEEKGIKWQEIDFEHELDSTLSYDENKKHLAEIMGVPEVEPEFEPEPASLEELLERAGITLPDVNSPYYQAQVEEVIRELTSRLGEAEKAEERAKKVGVIGRDVHGRPRKMTMSVNKLVDMIGDLNRQATDYEQKLTEERQRREEAEKRARATEERQIKMLTVKFKADMPQFIGADTKRYGPFRAGDVAILPEGNAAVLVERGMAELWRAVGPAPPPVPPVYVPPPKPVEPRKGLTADQVRLLRAKFNVALMDELGRVPPNASSIFIVKLDEAKGKSYDETLKYLLDSVKEIVGREVARKELARPRVAPRERITEPYRPKEEKEREEPYYIIGRVPPSQPPEEALNGPEERPWPRHPTRREEVKLWKAFQYRLQELGMNAFDYQKEWKEYIFGSDHNSYKHLLGRYEFFVDSIIKGTELPPMKIWQGVPIPYGLAELLSDDPDQRVADIIIWVASNIISNARYQRRTPNVDEVIKDLEERGITITLEDVKDALMKGYKLKGTNLKYDQWFLNITLEDLEELLVTRVFKEEEGEEM